MTMLSSSPEVEVIIKNTAELGEKFNHQYVTVDHLALALLEYKNFAKIVNEFGCDTESMIEDMTQYLQSVNVPALPEGKSPKRTFGLERVFNRAFTQVLFHNRNYAQPADLYLSIYSEDKTYAHRVFSQYGLEYEEFIPFYNENYVEVKPPADEKYSPEKAEQLLEKYCVNLSALAKSGKIDPVIGRESEIDEIVQVFGKRNKNNIVLVGDPGVGKTAIAEGLANSIEAGDVPRYLDDHVVYSLDIGTVVAGCKYRGEFEEKVTEIIDALVCMKNSILFIDEAHQIQGAGAGRESNVDFSNMIKPAIGKGKIKVIASTTWEEYGQSFEKDRALARRFYRLAVDEPTPELAKKILVGLSSKFEDFHKCRIAKTAIETAVDYSVRFMADKKLPDKAIDLVDSAAARLKKEGKKNFTVNKKDVLQEVSRITRIPIDQLDLDKKDTSLATLDANIKEKVYGQDHVVDGVVDRIFVAKAGLKSSNKPIGSFLFLGPTGTGKTELAKQLSFNLSMPLLRYDMSEFQEKHTVARLIGAPPGYVGYEDGNLGGGMLVRDIEKNPNAIILFDEIEKAHPDVSNILLQMMDEGFVSSSNGKKADCRNCIILLTSNLGSAANEQNAIGFGRSQQKSGEDDKAVKKFFRPEFRNRLDGIHKFNYLSKESMTEIVNKFMNEVRVLLSDKKIKLVVSDDAIQYLIDKGFDPKMGARPLARVIDSELKVPLSKLMISGSVSTGDKVFVTASELGLVVDKMKAYATIDDEIKVI